PAAGGTVVTITGTGFDTSGATSVRFGASAATAVGCASATSCSATSPAGSCVVDVTVSLGGLTSPTSVADQFTYLAPAAGPGTYEIGRASCRERGYWTSGADPAQSGGSVKYSNQSGTSVILRFDGSELKLS